MDAGRLPDGHGAPPRIDEAATALTAPINAFIDAVTHEVAFHPERTGNGVGEIVVRAQLPVAATDAPVHEVVLGSPPASDRDGVVAHLVRLISAGLDVGRTS